MEDEDAAGPDDLVVPFIFVPHGDPEPTEWMARHPGWVRFPATLVPRADPRPGGEATPRHPPPTVSPSAAQPAPRPAKAPARRGRFPGVGGLPPRRQGGAGLGTVEDPVATYLRISAATDPSNTAPAILASKSATIPQQKLEDARFRAFLHLIRYDENGGVSDDQAYLARFGGKDPMTDAEMKNYKPKAEPWKHRKKKGGPLEIDWETAAGAYGIVEDTWKDAKAKLGVVDFDKKSQDRVVVYIIETKHATEDIRAGRIEIAIKKLNSQWSSLPGGVQSRQTLEQGIEKFKQFLDEELKKP